MSLVRRLFAFGRPQTDSSESAPAPEHAPDSDAHHGSAPSAWVGLLGEAWWAAKASRISAAAVVFAVLLQVAYRLMLPRILEQVLDGGITHHDERCCVWPSASSALLLTMFVLAAILQEYGMAALDDRQPQAARGDFRCWIAMPIQSQARRGPNFLDRMGADVDAIELATVQALPVSFMVAQGDHRRLGGPAVLH